MALIKSYKGFNKNLQCRNFQFEIGKEYEEPDAKACEYGFHACEYPLDVFFYYPPAASRYCEVEQSEKIDNSDSSKICSSKINIGAEISLKGMIDAAVKFIFEKVNRKDNKESNTGYQSAATNTGYYSAATNTGYYSAATNTGYYSAATNTGYQSAATNTGYYSAATNTGYQSAATNTGDYSAATNTGDRSAATNTGDRSAATNTGYYSAATNTGDRSAATNTGDYSAAEVSGKDSIAIVTGKESKARGTIGNWLVLTERGDWNGDTYPILDVQAIKVDGTIIKENTWYQLIGGKPVEVE